jgi:hypothetical protein
MTNPTTLGADGIALLATVTGQGHIWPINYTLPSLGEPIVLPASFYQLLTTPNKLMSFGWGLTDAGKAAWASAAATPANPGA